MKHVSIITAVGLLAVGTLLNASISAQPAEVRIVVTPDSGSYIYGDPDLGLDAATQAGSTLRFVLRVRSESIMNACSLGWIFYSPDNSITTGARIENVSLGVEWNSAALWAFDGGSLNIGMIDGVLPDRILAGGVGNANPPNCCGGGLQISNFIDFLLWTVTFDSMGIFCTDSAFYPPATNFLAIDENGFSIGPLWFGGNGDLSVGGTRTEAYCINVLERNCCAMPGDANHDGKTNIADITFLIARIFAGGPQSACCREADANGDARMDIADVVYLIRRIFAGGPAPVCGVPGNNC